MYTKTIKTLIYVLLVVFAVPVSAFTTYSNYDQTATTETITSSTNIYLKCPDGYIIESLLIPLDSTFSSNQTLTFNINGSPAGTGIIDSNQNFVPFQVTGLSLPCEDNNVLTISGHTSGSLYWRKMNTTFPTGIQTYDIAFTNVSSTTAYSGGFDLTPPSTAGGGSEVVFPESYKVYSDNTDLVSFILLFALWSSVIIMTILFFRLFYARK